MSRPDGPYPYAPAHSSRVSFWVAAGPVRLIHVRLCVGRKNWLFAGSEQGGRNAAALYSVIETCARLGINSHEYPTDILARVGTHAQLRVAELTPGGWLAAQGTSTS